jgi:excisionase family DNA binding protein
MVGKDPVIWLEVLLLSDPWLSADDIAVHLGVTKDTVYVWIAEKDMPAHKVGRLWKFQASEIDAWVRSGSAASLGDSATRNGA